jgi:hypothetical protein
MLGRKDGLVGVLGSELLKIGVVGDAGCIGDATRRCLVCDEGILVGVGVVGVEYELGSFAKTVLGDVFSTTIVAPGGGGSSSGGRSLESPFSTLFLRN